VSCHTSLLLENDVDGVMGGNPPCHNLPGPLIVCENEQMPLLIIIIITAMQLKIFFVFIFFLF
jgi:hypothetical protein